MSSCAPMIIPAKNGTGLDKKSNMLDGNNGTNVLAHLKGSNKSINAVDAAVTSA
eukprot:CAMPEP_0172514428 /NCGR_PEP_ID=MMETSP1066-20121228/260018_1 /TAXON_ID=671091 /ORGANISM="Coscinodiscus wailesii, Strain CCMP2513" /LENGTH=53 /DNA_ID=CAMNT_0013295089 /DNA_START=66 /DNA_END=223 /DNA_ORIENTATION=+